MWGTVHEWNDGMMEETSKIKKKYEKSFIMDSFNEEITTLGETLMNLLCKYRNGRETHRKHRYVKIQQKSIATY